VRWRPFDFRFANGDQNGEQGMFGDSEGRNVAYSTDYSVDFPAPR
jgi:hypothetical protein